MTFPVVKGQSVMSLTGLFVIHVSAWRGSHTEGNASGDYHFLVQIHVTAAKENRKNKSGNI